MPATDGQLVIEAIPRREPVVALRLEEDQREQALARRSAGKAAASEEASRTLRYVEPLSDARTPLADFFSILLGIDGHTWP